MGVHGFTVAKKAASVVVAEEETGLSLLMKLLARDMSSNTMSWEYKLGKLFVRTRIVSLSAMG